VIATWNTVGYLIQTGKLDANLVLDNFGAQLERCWRAAWPVIDARRRREGDEGLFGYAERARNMLSPDQRLGIQSVPEGSAG
jgi:hypothetical protein